MASLARTIDFDSGLDKDERGKPDCSMGFGRKAGCGNSVDRDDPVSRMTEIGLFLVRSGSHACP